MGFEEVDFELPDVPMVANFIGWIYFVCWSMSFYPQVMENRQRKRVVGLSFDLLVYNVVGFTCYMCYNILLYFSPAIRDLYQDRHGDGAEIPVQLNDIAFSVHAWVLTMFTLYQCLIYERGDQEVSAICKGLSAHVLLSIFTVTAAALVRIVDWLWLVNYLGYIKIFISLIKFAPQAHLNYVRKSTSGFAIGLVLLDLFGGVMSILQMVLLTIYHGELNMILGNLPKLLLGLVSVFFDVIFIIQHYILYQSTNIERWGQVVTDYETDTSELAASHPSA